MVIELDSISYSELIEMGFVQQNVQDEVSFRENGYYGFCLKIEYIGLGTASKEQNKSLEK